MNIRQNFAPEVIFHLWACKTLSWNPSFFSQNGVPSNPQPVPNPVQEQKKLLECWKNRIQPYKSIRFVGQKLPLASAKLTGSQTLLKPQCRWGRRGNGYLEGQSKRFLALVRTNCSRKTPQSCVKILFWGTFSSSHVTIACKWRKKLFWLFIFISTVAPT